MQFEITKRCADSLRALALSKFGIQLKSSHAHELVAAYFGYSSRASMLADLTSPIYNLPDAEFIVLTPSAEIQERRSKLNGLPPNLPDNLAEGIYLPLYEQKWVKQVIWPTLEELGSALADQYFNSNPFNSSFMKIQRHGVKLEFENKEVAITVFREYVSPSHLLSSQDGKKGVVDVFNLRRIAGKIGYIKTSHYSAEADTLDAAVIKMRDTYYQLINNAKLSPIEKPKATLEPNFSEWLGRHKKRNSPLGDLASKRGFIGSDIKWPVFTELESYKDYLLKNNPPLGATSALEDAWSTYQAFLKRKQTGKLNKRQAPSPLKRKDVREIVFVKNVVPIHYSKRTVEDFAPGDEAWISWEGSKAIPVIVVEKDEMYYTFQMERPLKKAGQQHYVRLDEVRSTPELACINHITM